jgi:hypothetical protein
LVLQEPDLTLEETQKSDVRRIAQTRESGAEPGSLRLRSTI